jgi:hypothetical protein
VLSVTPYASTGLDEGLPPGTTAISMPFSLGLLVERATALVARPGDAAASDAQEKNDAGLT